MMDLYSKRPRGGKRPQDRLLTLTDAELALVDERYFCALNQLHAHMGPNSDRADPLRPSDVAATVIDGIPLPGLVHWEERLPGFFTTSMDVLHHGELVDRLQLVRVNPERYGIDVHVDLARRTIEQWRYDLDAVAVVNGSYYKADPYGEPMTPTQSQGRRLDRTRGYESNNGALYAEPRDPGRPKAKVVSYPSTVSADDVIEREGYQTVVFSYPLLLDEQGRNRAVDRPLKRATRTFVAEDMDGHILLANTQGGFFSLRRLGRFLKQAHELKLKTALAMDGGPPSCMAVKAGAFEYVRYGQWESLPNRLGQEVFAWHDENSGKWKIPIVISVRPRR